jgi:hypothetical protein
MTDEAIRLTDIPMATGGDDAESSVTHKGSESHGVLEGSCKSVHSVQKSC